MKSLGKDMRSLLVAVILTVGLLLGSDKLTHWLIQKQGTEPTTMILTNFLPVDLFEVFVMVVLMLIAVTLCLLLTF